jgi:hypothetical protein
MTPAIKMNCSSDRILPLLFLVAEQGDRYDVVGRIQVISKYGEF